MNEIGELFRVTREDAGVSIEEASEDLDIKEVILENIEDGNIGCFKDIFILKENIYNYAKYLGINPDKIVDEFNEYMFEYTSKIPVDEIEKKLHEETKQEKKEIVSPYTLEEKKSSKKIYIFMYVFVILIAIGIIFWSVKQITTGHETAAVISYVK